MNNDSREFVSRSAVIDALNPIAEQLSDGLQSDIASAIMSIPSADRPQGVWIPCSERLPRIGEHHISEPCLVYCKCGAYAFAELEENIFGQVGWNCERDDDYHEPIGEVVAWMPLPEPWKGADDDTD